MSDRQAIVCSEIKVRRLGDMTPMSSRGRTKLEVIMDTFQVYRLFPEFLDPAFVSSQFHLREPGWKWECWCHILAFWATSKDLLSTYHNFWFPFLNFYAQRSNILLLSVSQGQTDADGVPLSLSQMDVLEWRKYISSHQRKWQVI